MSERPINEDAIREAVRAFDGSVGEAVEIMEALTLAVRSLNAPHERRGMLFLVSELEQRIGKIGEAFDRAWPAVGFQGEAR